MQNILYEYISTTLWVVFAHACRPLFFLISYGKLALDLRRYRLNRKEKWGCNGKYLNHFYVSIKPFKVRSKDEHNGTLCS
jgi:hypothetical protein